MHTTLSRSHLTHNKRWFPDSNQAIVEPTLTAEACQKRCADSDVKCEYWDWTGLLGKDSKECWLKKKVDCTPTNTIKWGSASGPKSCNPDDADDDDDDATAGGGGGGTQSGGDAGGSTGNGKGTRRPDFPSRYASFRFFFSLTR